MKKISSYVLLMLFLWTSLGFANIHLNIVGRVEKGMLMDQHVLLNIKMDTGAKTASLNAHDIKIVEKEGKKWVSFIIDAPQVKKDYRFEYPLKRIALIKKRIEANSTVNKNDSLLEHRPVIEMELCIGDEVELIEVGLTDRSNFIYPMLLGRTAMEQFAILIDPTASRTLTPTCTEKTPVSNVEEKQE